MILKIKKRIRKLGLVIKSLKVKKPKMILSMIRMIYTPIVKMIPITMTIIRKGMLEEQINLKLNFCILAK